VATKEEKGAGKPKCDSGELLADEQVAFMTPQRQRQSTEEE